MLWLLTECFGLGCAYLMSFGIKKEITLFLYPSKEVSCISPPLWIVVYKDY